MKKRMKILLALLLTVSIGIVAPGFAFGADKLAVKDGDGTTTFKVEHTGAITTASTLLANGAEAVGASPIVLKQLPGNGGMVFTNGEQTNPKQGACGWDPTHTWFEVLAVHQNVGYKPVVLNPYGGRVGIGTTAPSHPLEMASGAYVSAGGVWTNASSREYKTDIKQLTAEKAMTALTQLKPVEFAYKADSQEKHVGFIAEDAPQLVAAKDGKGMSPMDVVAVLTKVVQEQQRTVTEQRATIAELSRRLAVVEKGVKIAKYQD